MVSTVFGKFRLVSGFIRVFSVSAKTEMLNNVGNLVKFGTFGEAHAATKLDFHVHDGSTRYVNQKAFGTIL